MLNKVLYVDVETTGLNPRSNGICQIAWMVEIDGEVVTESSLLVNPPEWAKIEKKALEIHGIPESLFREGKSYQEIHDLIEADISVHVSRYDRSDKFLLAGYNVGFDFDFLKRLWEDSGDKYLGSLIHFGRFLDARWAIPFYQFAEVLPWTENIKLGTVADIMGIKGSGDAHDAMVDLQMTRQIVHELSSRLHRLVVTED